MPDGYRVSLDQQKSVKVEGDCVALTAPDGSKYLWPAGHAAYAANVVTAIDAVMATGAAGNTPITPLPVITNISMSNPDITLANLVITGFGFSVASAGAIHWEDVGGGQDSNGHFSTCTIVNDRQMTAVYGGAGDGILPAGAVDIYYQDGLSHLSNIIAGTCTGGTVVTIP